MARPEADAKAARRRELLNARRKARSEAGLCVRCGRNPATGYYCAECAEKHVMCGVRRYSKRIAKGLCAHCGKHPRETLRQMCKKCLKKYAERATRRFRAIKSVYTEQVWAHYGRICVCCGETEPRFLTIDHINNDGNVHRRKVNSANIWKWLVDNNFPDTIQILCFNCNCGKNVNGGICPHKERRSNGEAAG